MRILLITSLTSLLFAGCRLGQSDSDLRDLSNFTRAESTPLVKNQCHGFFKDPTEQQAMENWLNTALPPIKQPAQQLSNAYFKLNTKNANAMPIIGHSLRRALSAVPVNLQQAYFATGGEIVVDDNASAICLGEYQKLKVHARTFVGEGTLAVDDLSVRELVPNGDVSAQPSSARNLEVSGCWVIVADQFDQNGQMTSWHPQIVLNSRVARTADGREAATEIEHSTVRLFGYLLSQILAHIDVQVSSSNVFDVSSIRTNGPNQLFTTQVTKLLDEVRKDISGKNTHDFFYYRKALATLDQAKKNAQSVNEEVALLEMSMHHYTFAEAFDSYYCSNDTNMRMQNEFNNTYRIFYSQDHEGRQIGLAAELDYIRIDESSDPDSGFLFPETGYQFADLSLDSLAQNYALTHMAFMRVFHNIGRSIGHVFRGVGRFVAGAVRVVATVAQAAVKTVIKGTQLVARAAVGLVKGTLYIAGGIVGHVYSILAPRHATHLAQYRGMGPFRQGFTDATRFWYPVQRIR